MEVRVALDTNRITDLFRGDSELGGRLAECDEVWVPLFVLGELQAGLYAGSRRERNEVLLRAFLDKPTVKVLLPSRETAQQYARLFVQLKLAGTPIPDNDLWIAALTLEYNLRLITRDRHFDCIPWLLRG